MNISKNNLAKLIRQHIEDMESTFFDEPVFPERYLSSWCHKVAEHIIRSDENANKNRNWYSFYDDGVVKNG